MEWIADPAAWVGLATLIVLEIVLGIDNLVFIAILADKLPAHQRDRARVTGLLLALVMRLVLLTVMAQLIRLTRPLFGFWVFEFSGRDLILLAGGFFLLWKATTELHERLEGVQHAGPARKGYASFTLVLVQIVILDAVFSLDSIITAVGMVEHLPVMMIAVVVAMSVMIMASKPLTRFVSAHPTVVVLCLSFLLMIGFSLVAEGFGLKLPKGYLYAAIGFSIMIEFFNQLRMRNIIKHESGLPMRDRTAKAVLRLLGDRHGLQEAEGGSLTQETLVGGEGELPAFGDEERKMVSGVLTLGERSVLSIMTPRTDISWLDISDSPDILRRQIIDQPHGMYPVCGHAGLDHILGIGRAKDLLSDLVANGTINRQASLRPPLIVPESVSVVRVIEMLRQSRGHMAMVSDEYGTILGLVTPMDVLEAIAGEFPDVGETLSIQVVGPDHWLVDGMVALHTLESALGVDGLAPDDDDYSTLAGLLLDRLQQLPELGQVVECQGLRFEVIEVIERRISQVDVTRLEPQEQEEADSSIS